MHFASPLLLLWLLIVPLFIFMHVKKRRKARLRVPSLTIIASLPPSKFVKWRHLLFALRIMALIFMIIALARPQTGTKRTEVTSSGVDIMLALDVSGSMKALDFEIRGERQNRLFVIKSVVSEFIAKRVSDRLGMVVFGTEAFLQCPLTLDNAMVISYLQQLSIGMAGDNTAIGSAIAAAAQRLQKLEAKSKIIILVTDGSSNAGDINPELAAQSAAALGIKIYTIAVGQNGKVPIPVMNPLFGREQLQYAELPVDEKLLQKIAETTKGQFFKASDTESLKNIYNVIDKLEKTEVKIKEYTNYTEIYAQFLTAALGLLVLELLLRKTRLLQLP